MFFRAIALHIYKHLTRKNVHQMHKKWLKYNEGNKTKNKQAILIRDLPKLESCFKININMYSMLNSKKVVSVYKSLNDYDETMHLNLYKF